MKYIDINLRGAREPCTSYIIGSAGENIAEAFRAKIPDKYLNCNIVFEFQMENGEKHSSKLLPWAKEIIFEMPYYLMAKGRMVVAITATDKTSKAIYRLFEKTFVVVTSISKQPTPDGSDVAAFEERLRTIEELYATREWVLNLLRTFRKTTSGIVIASMNSGYVFCDETGTMYVSVDGDVARINEKGELEVLV